MIVPFCIPTNSEQGSHFSPSSAAVRWLNLPRLTPLSSSVQHSWWKPIIARLSRTERAGRERVPEAFPESCHPDLPVVSGKTPLHGCLY